MKLICTNSNKYKDQFLYEFEKLARNTQIDIAVPFFTYDEIIDEAVKNGCSIRLVVRLGDVTSPKALNQLIDENNVSIRYFTSSNFHSKLYIFGDDFAFVGSSNLTRKGLAGNQEINVTIPSDDPRFDVLKETFEDYWDSGEVLTKEKLDEYSGIYEDFKPEVQKNSLERKIKEAFGEVVVQTGVEITNKRSSKKQQFENQFLKKYQLFLKKFDALRDMYIENSVFKIPKGSIPLRLEIDQFLSWVRENKASGDSYLNSPIRQESDLRQIVVENIKEFCEDTESDYVIRIKNQIWPRLNELLRDEETIKSLTQEEIFEVLRFIHAFNAGAYRYLGGGDKARNDFFSMNDMEKVKKMIVYLLFGGEGYQKRIARCIFDTEYKLDGFSESCVKELFGWKNSNNIPICNDRTLKSMQWLGFGKL